MVNSLFLFKFNFTWLITLIFLELVAVNDLVIAMNTEVFNTMLGKDY